MQQGLLNLIKNKIAVEDKISFTLANHVLSLTAISPPYITYARRVDMTFGNVELRIIFNRKMELTFTDVAWNMDYNPCQHVTMEMMTQQTLLCIVIVCYQPFH